jgi:2-methylisocitrate lyase-like PEP mutase family enzyme
MSRLGSADLGLATLPEMHQNAAMIASLNPSVPVIADADTGYGGPIMVSRTTRLYALSGVAALHIEDQVQEKRCGHLTGKQCVGRDVFYSRLRAAVKTRDDMASQMLVIARTDARADLGWQEAVDRLKGAVDCGVDVLFFEALQSREECEMAVKLFAPTPLLLNMVPGGKTPQMSVKQAKDVGFKIYINPTLGLETVVRPLQKAYNMLVDEGTDECEPIGPKALFDICGLQESMAFDQSVGGVTFGASE